MGRGEEVAKRKKVTKEDKILKAIGGLTEVVQLLVNKEIQHEQNNLRGDGRQGVRDVSGVRADAEKAGGGPSAARSGGESAGPRGDVRASIEARKRAEEQALNQGVENAVSSYRPANDPVGLPPRNQQVKLLYAEGETIVCQSCKKPHYTVYKDITTAHKVADLMDLLGPYSDAVNKLTVDTPVNQKNGVSLPCDLCGEEWGVVIL